MTIEDLAANDIDRVSDAAAIIAHAHAAGTAEAAVQEVDGQDGVVSVVTPAGYTQQFVDLADQYGRTPRFHRRGVTAHRTASMVDYMAKYADADTTVVYVEPAAFRATAIIDDSGRRLNRVTLQLKSTPAWERWHEADRKMLGQVAFAELVEDGITEIASPSGTELLELAQTMQATNNASFRSSRRLQSGETQFAYVEELEASGGKNGELSIPSRITLVLAPFEGAEPRQITARLRFRLAGSKLSIGVILDDIDRFLTEAIDAEIAKIQAAHEALFVWGTP